MNELNPFDECEPLKTLPEVLNWSPCETNWSTKVTGLASRGTYCYNGSHFKCHKKFRAVSKILKTSAPKTLICHDMKGGYLDDKFVHGTTYNYQYLFNHWSVIDIFVYFSHHFVTVPPLMWINAAHAHGVQILGTIITEATDGEKIWETIFEDQETQNIFVDQLSQICKHYKFDGYLINIENPIKPDHLPKFIDFLRDLKLKIRDFGILIWYDAVSLQNGKLDWQNELNQHNETAFELCDGIFLNYGWKVENLERSLSNAGARQFDVYVGVDVFGRGCHGGGGFNSDLAMSVIRSYNLSAAIFGFGWTHETQASDFNFFTVERQFWAKLLPYLFVHVPNRVPFETRFNPGVGVNPSRGVSWYNLSTQSFQLTFPSCSDVYPELCCMIQYFDGGISNGGCISLNTPSKEIEIHRLFLCDFPCNENAPLELTVSAKMVGTFLPFRIILIVESLSKNFTVILRVVNFAESVSNEKLDYSCLPSLNEKVNSTRIVVLNENGWISNKFVLKFDGVITEINAQVQKPVMIGYLSVE